MVQRSDPTLNRMWHRLALAGAGEKEIETASHLVGCTNDGVIELPLDAWMLVADYLHDDVHSALSCSLQSLSETSYALNLACCHYLRTRVRTAIARPTKNENLDRPEAPLRRGDKILRRLARQDSTVARMVWNQYSGADTDANVSGTPQPEPSECATTATTRLQQQLAVTAQQANLRLRQLSDEFAARLYAQRERLLFWTRTAMGCIIVAVMMTTCWTAAATNQNSHYSQRMAHVITGSLAVEESNRVVDIVESLTLAHVEDGHWMFIRLLLGVLFSVTVAWGVSRQTSRTQHTPLANRSRSSSPVPSSARVPTKGGASIKRSQSMAGDLGADRNAINTPDLELFEWQNDSLSQAVHRTQPLMSSSSAPNLMQFALMDDDENDTLLSDDVPSLWLEHAGPYEAMESVSDDPLRSTAAPRDVYDPDPQSQDPVTFPSATRMSPHGCVGSYRQVVALAKRKVIEHVKDQRQRTFESMDPDERGEFSAAFLDACTNDESLDTVRNMCRSIPVDDFYVGSDGTESCALHTAAFHGATQVLHFLCRGVDDDADSTVESNDTEAYNDGGLCRVNATDANGWTALHFSASAGNVDAVRILVLQHGADLNVQAVNGYTPWQWAHRLQKVAVATELRRLAVLASDTVHQQRRAKFQQHIRQHAGSIALVAVLLLIPNVAWMLSVVSKEL